MQLALCGLGAVFTLPLALAGNAANFDSYAHHVDSHDGASRESEVRHADASLASMQSSDLIPTVAPLIPHQLRQFILEENQSHDAEHGIGRRQGVAPGGGIAPGEINSPTQMPSVTAFQLSGKVIQYTQTFPPTPVPWAAPSNGAIGLGTIQGKVGTVKGS